MKKNKRHLYKRLPKYALGTMKPIYLGYQAGHGTGSAHVETQPEVSLSGEIQATRAGALPRAINSFMGYTPYIINNLDLSNRTRRASTSITSKELTSNTPLYNTPLQPTTQTLSLPTPNWESQLFVPKNITAGYDLPGMTANIAKEGTSVFGTIGADVTKSVSEIAAERGGNLLTGKAAEALADQTQKELSKQAAKQVGKNIAGKVLGVVGSAKGLIDLGMQAADFGSHRSSGDMLANLGRQHYTTDKGNTYDTYLGPNVNNEVALEKANARAKQLNWLASSAGTGTTIGSLFGPLGTAIGAGAGLLLGGLGSLFGWGDNTEDVEREARILADNTAMYNRQQEAVAKSKDVAAEFNDRQSIPAAADGKSAYGPMDKFLPMFKNKTHGKDVEVLQGSDGPKIGIATSMGEKGEGAYNFETRRGSIIDGFEKGKGDVQPLYHTDGDSTVIFSKKLGFADIANPYILDTQRNWNIINNMKGDAQTQQVQKAVATAKIEKNDMKLREINNAQSAFKQQMEMKKYKNGKLPGFWKGTDYLMSAIPHIAALGLSRNQYNRAKYADMPDYPNIVDSSANTEAINILGRRMFNPAPMFEHIHKTHRYNLYDINRTPGLTAGGQAIARANNAISEAQRGAEVLAQADEINNRYTADYANALANYGKWISEMMTNNNYARAAFRQQQNAAKEGWMAQYEKNGLTALADLASDIMGVRQFNRSEDYQNRTLKLYNQQVENDSVNAKAALAQAEQARLDREAAYRNVVKDASKAAYPAFVSQGLLKQNGVWNAYGMVPVPQLGNINIPYRSWMKGIQ